MKFNCRFKPFPKVTSREQRSPSAAKREKAKFIFHAFMVVKYIGIKIPLSGLKKSHFQWQPYCVGFIQQESFTFSTELHRKQLIGVVTVNKL